MSTPTRLFTSRRERRLWLCALAVVVAIYSTLGLAGSLADVLRERDLLPAAVFVLMLVTVGAIVGSGLKTRPGRREVWVALGLMAVYGMLLVRMGGSMEERTHLFEYGIVSVLIYQALRERSENGRRVPVPALLALVATSLLGWIDEGIQAVLPDRSYDNFDVLSNVVAAVIGIAGSVIVGSANERLGRRRGGGR